MEKINWKLILNKKQEYVLAKKVVENRKKGFI